MGNNYWIKLYHDILDDPIFGSMTDRLFRRTIQLYLMAGETDADGLLPVLPDMAWRLHMDEDELAQDLMELEEIKIISSTKGPIWKVENFKRSAKPLTNAERQRIFRVKTTLFSRYISATEDIDIDQDVTHPPLTSLTSDVGEQVRSTQPIAIRVFRKAAHRFPNKSWWREVDEIVGEHPLDLELWGKIVRQWVGRGWNPINVAGMLEFFKRKEIPAPRGDHIPAQTDREKFDEEMASDKKDDNIRR